MGTSVAPAPSVAAETKSPFLDIRVRPIALLDEIPGAEIGFFILRNLEIGPTIHYASGTNTVRDSTLRTWELGIKATYLAWERFPHEGIYLSGTFYDYLNNSGSFISQPAVSTGFYSTLGYMVTAGYQWQLGIFHSDALSLRLGAGLGYTQQHFDTLSVPGRRAPTTTSIGVLSQLEPTIEFTLGYSI